VDARSLHDGGNGSADAGNLESKFGGPCPASFELGGLEGLGVWRAIRSFSAGWRRGWDSNQRRLVFGCVWTRLFATASSSIPSIY
jgi:hypothetical protein